MTTFDLNNIIDIKFNIANGGGGAVDWYTFTCNDITYEIWQRYNICILQKKIAGTWGNSVNKWFYHYIEYRYRLDNED